MPRTPIEGIKHVDMVPGLGAQSLEGIKIAVDWCHRHGYLKNNFDVDKWAAPKFLEQAAKALIEEQWQKVAKAKLPVPAQRIG